MSSEVVLVDAGGTNIGSMRYALERLGVAAAMTEDPARIRAASHLILPGVGAAGPGMQRLRAAGLDRLIGVPGQPVLGVCLGMQLLFEYSEENETSCLGLLPGSVRALGETPGRRVPHMGWNTLDLQRRDTLLKGVGAVDYAYFVHSYVAPVNEATLASCTHGETFAAVVRRGSVYGTQFHPERSSTPGARVLANFLNLPSGL